MTHYFDYSRAVLSAFEKWWNSLRANLRSVRRGQGAALDEELEQLEYPHSIIVALENVELLPKMLRRYRLNERWTRKICRKVRVWRQVLRCALSRGAQDGVDPVSARRTNAR